MEERKGSATGVTDALGGITYVVGATVRVISRDGSSSRRGMVACEDNGSYEIIYAACER
jgi:hypothetical protein